MLPEVKKFSDFKIELPATVKFVGDKIRLAKVLNTQIMVHGYSINLSRYPERGSKYCLWLQISVEGKKYLAFSIAQRLMLYLPKVPKDGFPFSTKIINDNDYYEFT